MRDQQTVIQRRRTREKDHRIRTIVQAAKKVFFSKGYVKATMDEIALEAEISKPTIYLYFKTKEDLFYSLMLPVIDEIKKQLDRIEERVEARKYNDGASLLHDMVNAWVHSHDMDPDAFRVVQLFQQAGLVAELHEETRNAMDEKGRYNFATARRIVSKAIEQGLVRQANVHELVDVLYGFVIGVIQVENAKSVGRGTDGHLVSTMKLAERLIIESVATVPEKIQAGVRAEIR